MLDSSHDPGGDTENQQDQRFIHGHQDRSERDLLRLAAVSMGKGKQTGSGYAKQSEKNE
jgi:hypothetical protein